MPNSDLDLGDFKSNDHLDGGLAPASGSGQSYGRQNLYKYGELIILGYNGQLPQGKFGPFSNGVHFNFLSEESHFALYSSQSTGFSTTESQVPKAVKI